MYFTAESSSDGVREQVFDLGDVPGLLWTPADADGTRPLIVVGHGGGQHKRAPNVLALARRFVTDCGFAVVAVDAPSHGDRARHEEFSRIASVYETKLGTGGDLTPLVAGFQALVSGQIVPEWRAALDAVQRLGHVGAGPVGYWGVSLGCGIGVPFVAAEARVRAAVLGLAGAEVSTETAARITVPVEFLVQWDDERVPRAQSLTLFDALASAEKALHANSGGHGDLPSSETDSSVRFFARHLC
jgi:dienelactone hydrolase